jgi:hypothetical protein
MKIAADRYRRYRMREKEKLTTTYGACWTCGKDLLAGCQFFELSGYNFQTTRLDRACSYSLKFCDRCFISVAGNEFVVEGMIDDPA